MAGKYPHVSGLEHDEHGHPSGNARMHQRMTDKRRDKLVALSKSLPLPEIHGDQEGDLLLISWGSNCGQIKEAVNRLRAEGHRVGAAHLRHLHPMPAGLDRLWAKFKKVAVAELNDVGPFADRFPQRNFASRLPVDARFHESVEQAVALLAAGVAVVERTYRITQERHG